MTKPREILVAVDFGDASARAVTLAGAIARHCDATLQLLHAETLEAPIYFTSEQIASLEAQRRSTRNQAEQYVAKFGRSHTPYPFTPRLAEQPPADAILHAAARADLVVMGTHGRRGPARWWLGSVAERVLRDVNRPLLVVRAEASPDAAAAFARVLVHAPTPGSGTQAAAYAADVIGCFGGTIVRSTAATAEAAVHETEASLLVVATPRPVGHAWVSHSGDPLLRDCRVPILFVPEVVEGAIV